ncbi:MAG: DeoR/GlpR family DNA-binding transcription regulator [Bacilli bacterium]|nr:DeoR/GlpR family DNA-binding transcription regulator [Bacilli bacterium]
MLREARLSKILEVVNERKYVSFHDLMEITGASESSIRADLVYLDSEGKLIRLRGGAQAIEEDPSSIHELSVEAKMELQVEEKKLIAEYAAKLVKDNTAIYIDAGTTTYHFVEAIEAKNLKVLTNSVTIARKLKLKGYRVYITGGEFKSITDAFIGSMTRDIISQFSFDIGFFGCNGVDLNKGLTTPDYEEAIVKKAAMEQCKKLYVLSDHTKFGVRTAVSFHPFVGQEIITDKIYKQEFKNKNIIEVK